jgi:hypothetical protein
MPAPLNCQSNRGNRIGSIAAEILALPLGIVLQTFFEAWLGV